MVLKHKSGFIDNCALRSICHHSSKIGSAQINIFRNIITIGTFLVREMRSFTGLSIVLRIAEQKFAKLAPLSTQDWRWETPWNLDSTNEENYLSNNSRLSWFFLRFCNYQSKMENIYWIRMTVKRRQNFSYYKNIPNKNKRPIECLARSVNNDEQYYDTKWMKILSDVCALIIDGTLLKFRT